MLHGVTAVTVAVMITPSIPGKGTRKPNLGGRRAGRLHTRQETQNLSLKAITEKSGSGVVVALPFLAPNAARAEGDGHGKDWAIQHHLQKLNNGKKVALKERYWVPEEDGTYDVERIRRKRPSHIFEMESSATREYLSLIHTFFLTHTIGGVLLNPTNKALYDKMLRLQGLGSNTPSGLPYTEDEIMAIVRGGKQRGHIPSVVRVLPKQGTVILPSPPCTHSSDLESQPEYGGGSRSGCAGMMRTAVRMGRMRAIVRRCWIKLVILVNIGLYLADNASFVTSSPVLVMARVRRGGLGEAAQCSHLELRIRRLNYMYDTRMEN
nr:hypothetical protein [Tanacetum cinerariifolium]